MLVMLAANAVGLSGGLALAGWLSQWYGWRAVFLIVGLPGIAIGLLVYLLAAEPRRRGVLDPAPPQRSSPGEVLRTLASHPSLRWVALLLCMVPVTGFAFVLWGASLVQRHQAMGTTKQTDRATMRGKRGSK